MWWRIERPLSMLRARGHDATWHRYDDLEGTDLSGALVIIHRMIPMTPEAFIYRLRKEGASSILYSMDDYTIDADVLTEYLEKSGGLTSAAIERIVARIPLQLETISLCDGLLVSTEDLAIVVSDTVNTGITVLENAIDETWYTEALSSQPEHISNGDLVYIGYASGRRPEADLVEMSQAWGRIAEDYPNVRFVVAGYQHDIIDRNIPLDRKVRIPFQPLNEWPKSMQVDIGCCPLSTDIRFNRGKSSIKWMEYTLAGAAVVASDHDVYNETVLDCVTGYIAKNTVESWYEALTTFLYHKGSKKGAQDAAYYDIHNYKSLEATIENWEFQLGNMIR
jgi:glycosyltransferase involved in cell wall biosynthesis